MANIVAANCKVLDVQPSKNDEYASLVLVFPQEVYGKTFTIDELKRPPRTYILFNVSESSELMSLSRGQIYKFIFSVDLQPANNSNGKQYPASVKYNVIKFEEVK